MVDVISCRSYKDQLRLVLYAEKKVDPKKILELKERLQYISKCWKILFGCYIIGVQL